MKYEDQVARAHDTLMALLTGELQDFQFDSSESQGLVIAAADVLCWVLDHDHNQSFQENLDKLNEAIAALGYVQVPVAQMKDTTKDASNLELDQH